MKHILFILVLAATVNANAQNGFQSTPKGDLYQIFTHGPGEKIKLGQVITFQFIQKTDKDSILFSTYAAGHPVQAQIQASQNAGDLMDVFPLLAEKDSAIVKAPTDSIFKGHEDQRPPFFPKGSNLVFVLKIVKVQNLDEAMAERNAEIEKVKATETQDAAKYIASHKLVLTTTPSGLKYVITKPSLKLKPQKGDTLLVNYAGRNLDGTLFDSSIESVAREGGLKQPGRTYEPIQVIVGTGGVIPGWDEGLLLLNEGSKAIFVIPSALAYGAQGQGEIKPYSTLVFDIELVKVKPAKHTPAKPVVKKKPLHKKPTTATRKK
jgi:FKBP-type peptidyl-prolyl cis-trans isomerase FkpA